MFSGHTHSHDGTPCHGHGGSNQRLPVGFGGPDEQPQLQSNQQMAMAMNPMMMMMMNNQTQNNPQMMELAKKMFEQRQKLMKEFMEQGGKSNPQALKDLMSKSAQLQSQAMAEFKNVMNTQQQQQQQNQESQSTNSGSSNQMSLLQESPKPDSNSNLLFADLNTSKLNDLINKNFTPTTPQNDEEKRILDAIANKDYSSLNAVKATQYGVLERLKELIESKEVDPHKPDHENVYLLHWAAINNRIDIAQYLLSLGVEIDPIGGELRSTPLNWAARSGHVQMVILLMQHGANPQLFDAEGYSTIHLATMFGHSSVVAYLLVKGIDPDMLDQNGLTSLMYAAKRVHSRDPAQLLITFNARLNAQDQNGNTALHYSVAFNNLKVLEILLLKGASVDVRNKKSQTVYDLAIDTKKFSAANFIRSLSDIDKEALPNTLKPLSRNKETRKMFTQIYPMLLLFYFGLVFQADLDWLYKFVLILVFYGISYTFKLLFFDKHVNKNIPIAITLSFISWSYITWFIYFTPYVFDFDLYNLGFLIATILSWYNLYKSSKTDPGIIKTNRNEMNQTLLKMLDRNEFSIDDFCTSCIIRRPLRSKHCAECDHCVSKFDHHCPWVNNCIGEDNLKYFVGFLFWTPICLLFYLHGAYKFYMHASYPHDISKYPDLSTFGMFYQFMMNWSWAFFFTCISLFNVIWISALFFAHFYQTICINLTTNERLNMKRYKHFYDSNGQFKNPYNLGIMQNLVDLLNTKILCWRPSTVNWRKEYEIDDLKNIRSFHKKNENMINI